MSDATCTRLFFDLSNAFDHPMTWLTILFVIAGLAGGRWLIRMMYQRGIANDDVQRELLQRWKSWCWLSPVIIVPILLGVAWTVAAVLLLSLLCYRDYARVTGLFRERAVSICVVAGIFLVGFAALDHFERLFFAAGPLTVGVIAIISLQSDRPAGFIQRAAMGIFGFMMYGYSLGYLGQFAAVGDPEIGIYFRPILLLIILGVECNDIFASCLDKTFGGPILLPNTSSGKTFSGAVGAMILTTMMVAVLGHFIFNDTPIDTFGRLITLGVIISGLSQLSDLMILAVKRDVGVKDVGTMVPGHRGLLDRFNSLVLVAPSVYHYVSLSLGDSGPLGAGTVIRIFTGD